MQLEPAVELPATASCGDLGSRPTYHLATIGGAVMRATCFGDWDTLPRVGLFTGCAVAVATALLAACGASDESAWAGPPAPDADGAVSVETFETYRETVDEQWEDAPVLLATEFVKLEERTVARTSISGSGANGGEGTHTVTIDLTGLPDDAVRAERWVLTIEPVEDSFRLVSATRTLQCQPGRGHEDFAPEPCS